MLKYGVCYTIDFLAKYKNGKIRNSWFVNYKREKNKIISVYDKISDLKEKIIEDFDINELIHSLRILDINEYTEEEYDGCGEEVTYRYYSFIPTIRLCSTSEIKNYIRKNIKISLSDFNYCEKSNSDLFVDYNMYYDTILVSICFDNIYINNGREVTVI